MKRTILGSAVALIAACTIAGAQTQGTGTQGSGTSQPTSASGQAERQSSDKAKGQTVTLVGCIQQQQGANDDEFVLANASIGSDTSPTSTMAGSSSSSSSPTGTSSSPTGSSTSGSSTTGSSTTGSSTAGTSTGSTAGTSGTSTSGTSGSMPGHGAHMGTPGAASSYELTGDREDDLKQYVGQRVEITGSVEGHAGAGASVGGSAGTSPTGSSAGASGSGSAGTSGTSTTGTSGSGSMAGGVESGRSLPRLKITSFRAVGGSCSPAGGNR